MMMTKLIASSRQAFGLMKFTPIEESNMIAEPLAFQKGGLLGRLKSLIETRSTLNLMQVTFDKFNRRSLNKDFNLLYNKLRSQVRRKDYLILEKVLCPTLLRQAEGHLTSSLPLPYKLPSSSRAELVQARVFVENVAEIQSPNQWFQLTFKFHVEGKPAYHVLERNSKLKNFKFIKFYLQE